MATGRDTLDGDDSTTFNDQCVIKIIYRWADVYRHEIERFAYLR